MIIYLIKTSLCLGILLIVYKLFFEHEKIHHFKRLYLVASPFISLLIPFYTIEVTAPLGVPINLNLVGEELTFDENTSLLMKLELYSNYLLCLYVLIVSLLLFRFSKNLMSLILKAKGNQQVHFKNAKLILHPDIVLPFTFWKYIFIDKGAYEMHEIEEELLTHELVHVKQKHTVDILLIELFHIFFWFNPILIVLKKAIRLNHEFLADQATIEQHLNVPKYQLLLLKKSANNHETYLASNLNYLLTKKRFIMMTRSESKSKGRLKKVAVIPFLLGLVFLFATKVFAQDTVTPEMLKEYNIIAKKGKKNKLTAKETKRLKYIYGQMTEMERRNATPFPKKLKDHDGGHDHKDGDGKGHDHDGEHDHKDGEGKGHDHDGEHDHKNGDGKGHDHDGGHDHKDGDGKGHDHKRGNHDKGHKG